MNFVYLLPNHIINNNKYDLLGIIYIIIMTYFFYMLIKSMGLGGELEKITLAINCVL